MEMALHCLLGGLCTVDFQRCSSIHAPGITASWNNTACYLIRQGQQWQKTAVFCLISCPSLCCPVHFWSNLWIHYYDQVFSVTKGWRGRKNSGLVNSVGQVVHGLGDSEPIRGWKSSFLIYVEWDRLLDSLWLLVVCFLWKELLNGLSKSQAMCSLTGQTCSWSPKYPLCCSGWSLLKAKVQGCWSHVWGSLPGFCEADLQIL